MQINNVPDSVELGASTSVATRLANFPPQDTKVKAWPLDSIRDLRTQEALLTRDLIHVALGNEGWYVRYNPSYDTRDSAARLQGPDYKIAKNLDISLKDVAKRLVRMGKFYVALVAFTETYSVTQFGQCMHRFVSFTRRFVKEYIEFVCRVEYKFYKEMYTLRQLEQDALDVVNRAQVLYELVSAIHAENVGRQTADLEADFSVFMQDLKDDMALMTDSKLNEVTRGGWVINIVQARLTASLGDPESHAFLVELRDFVTEPYLEMLNVWLRTGRIEDPYDEFMIKQTQVALTERYWDSLVVRKDGLPMAFADKTLQQKILVTGKLLNVVKKCCTLHVSDAQLKSFGDLLAIDQLYNHANKQAMDFYISGYELPKLLVDLHRFYMFGDSGKWQQVLPLLSAKTEKLVHGFHRVFQGDQLVLQLMNVVFENQSFLEYLKEVSSESFEVSQVENFNGLRRLLERSLKQPANSEKITLASQVQFINFELVIPFPLNVVLTRTFIVQYQLVQRHLLVVNHHSYKLDEAWGEINKSKIWKYRKFSGDVKVWIRRVRALHQRMNQFVKLYLSYLSYDVIESEWQRLHSNAASDFPSLCSHLQTYLTTVLRNSLLTVDNLCTIEHELLQIIGEFVRFVSGLRKKLVLLNFDLYEHYKERLDQEYDEHTVVQLGIDLNNKLNEINAAFQDHLNAFIEGVKFYGDLNNNALLVLSDLLENAFPAV